MMFRATMALLLAAMLTLSTTAAEPLGEMEPGKGRDLRQRIKNGEKVTGTHISATWGEPMPKLLKRAGFDFCIMDTEHGPQDTMELFNMINSARHAGLGAWVRLREVDKEVSRVLDLGADGILIPLVETREQAEALVHYGRFQPIGDRGISTGSNQLDYQNIQDVPRWLRERDSEITLMVNIETPKGVENVDEIFSVEGIDGAVIGTGDLSYRLGHAGNTYNPDTEAAVEKVIAAGKRHGIWVATVIRAPEDVEKWVEREDYPVLLMSSEYKMLLIGAQEFLKPVREAAQ